MAVVTAITVATLGPALRLDPEFYTAPSAKRRADLEKIGVPFSSYFERIVHPSEFVREYLEEPGHRFLRAQNVRPGKIENREPVYVGDDIYRDNPDAIARTGDLLLVRTGANLADIARVTDAWEGAMVSSHTLRLVPRLNAPTCALEAFFCSSRGRGLLLGLRSGGTHGQINGSTLAKQYVPDLAKIEKRIQKLSDGVVASRASAEKFFREAEEVMALDLASSMVDLSPSLSYERRISEMFASHRFGAEYFMPAKYRAIESLGRGPHKTISFYFQSIKEQYHSKNEAKSVRNFDLSDAIEPFLDDSQNLSDRSEIGSTKKTFRNGDLVISRLRSYLKEIAVVRCSSDELCVGSSEFIVLRPISEMSATVLLVYLRSALVQGILTWSQDGSNHPRFNEDDLLALPVPNRLNEIGKKIDDLVMKSIKARQDAKKLFEQAINEVDEFVWG